MDLSIIIVNWNSKSLLRDCLESLVRFMPTGRTLEVIVVDNASYDGCGEMLAADFRDVVFIQSEQNLGFGRANNLGLSRARGNNILFLNPDTLFFDDSLSTLLDCFDSLPDAGGAGCKLLNRDGSLQTSCVQSFPTVVNQVLDSDWLRDLFPNSCLWGTSALHNKSTEPVPVEVVSGAALLVKRSVALEVGGFTPDFFMYAEDLDLCYKIFKSGRKVYYIPSASITHLGGASSSRQPGSFSTIFMRHSVCHFLRRNRGVFSAFAYRVAMALSAFIRLIIMMPLLLAGDRVVRHGTGSLRKWMWILQWSLGLEKLTRRVGA